MCLFIKREIKMSSCKFIRLDKDFHLFVYPPHRAIGLHNIHCCHKWSKPKLMLP